MPVLQSTTLVLLCTTKYYASTTKYYSSTTLYYKVLGQYYNVLRQYYNVLPSTTTYYSGATLKRHLQCAEQQEAPSNLLRLPRDMNVISGPHHIWNLIYNARSK